MASVPLIGRLFVDKRVEWLVRQGRWKEVLAECGSTDGLLPVESV